MIDLGANTIYIVGSYAGVILATIGLIAYVIRDARRVAANLAALEEQGIRRRSAGPTS